MEKIFNVKYNSTLDRLEMPKGKKINKWFKFIQKHKFFSIIFTSFFVFSGINFYMIYSFMKILENI